MSKVIAAISTSVDGYIVGPDDRPGCGLGVGGERLQRWRAEGHARGELQGCLDRTCRRRCDAGECRADHRVHHRVEYQFAEHPWLRFKSRRRHRRLTARLAKGEPPY